VGSFEIHVVAGLSCGKQCCSTGVIECGCPWLGWTQEHREDTKVYLGLGFGALRLAVDVSCIQKIGGYNKSV
jgi:hypothetical protein